MDRWRSGAAGRLAPSVEVVSVVATLVVAVLVVIEARPGRWPVAAAVAFAMVASTAPLTLELLTRRYRGHPSRVDRVPGADPDAGPTPELGTVTTLVRLGGEPLEVARTTILLACQAGPTAVVVDGEQVVPELIERLGVRVHRGAAIEDAITSAIQEVDTDGVLVLSGRAVPIMDDCRRAAAMLDETCGWVTGSTEPFGRDLFVSDGREVIGARLRSRARRAGVELWEPNATLIRTDLLRAHPLVEGRPWGWWLRARASEGHSGVTVPETLALRAAPAGAAAFWPDVISRQRGTAADLADAVTSGQPGRRFALLLTVRALYAVPLLAWATLPVTLVVTGASPVEIRTPWSIAVVLLLVVARWASLRAALGERRRPLSDIRSALHHFPGSLGSVPSAIRRRALPTRGTFSTRPLVWAALFVTMFTGASLIDRDPTAPVSRVAVGTALVTLALLWLFCVRALVQRGWERSSYRIPVSLGVRIGEVTARTMDCSPGGVGLIGDFDALDAAVGDEIKLTISLDDGQSLEARAVVAGWRHHGHDELVGLSLHLGDAAQGAWAAQLLRAATAPGSRRGHVRRLPTDEPATHEGRVGRVADRIVAALVILTSLVVLSALVLVMLGFQPLVIRSASMSPTIEVGDVVLSELVPVAELEPGDVVTRPERAGGGESLTHRLESIVPAGDQVVIRTRGDANDTGESWTVPADPSVRRVRWTIPWIGEVVIGVRSSPIRLAILVLVVALVLVAVFRPRRRRHRPLEDQASENRSVENEEAPAW